jgi:signal transduction histidine kinase/CheY-like chemotaxis protein/tetratricopeptide (TPR) repeat protein
MRWVILLLFIQTIIFSQKKTIDKFDSTAYYIQLAKFNKKINNYNFALEYSQKAIDYSNTKNETKNEALAYFSLGTTFFELNKNKDAIEAFLKSKALFNSQSPSSDQAFCFYNIGLCYLELENYNEAELYFNKAETIYETINIDATDILNLQKGIIYIAKGEINLAKELFQKIVAKKNPKFNIKAEAFLQLGKIEAQSDRKNLALNYLNKALTLNNNNPEQKAEITLALSRIFEKQLDHNKALKYLILHNQLKDSLINSNTQKLNIEDYNAFKEKERLYNIEQMSLMNESEQKINRFTKLISLLAIALISILSLLSLSLYKNNIIRKQTNLSLKEKNKELLVAKEKAEKASQARAEFLSTVSHELRTPLNAINGITYLLLQEEPKKNQIKYLKKLKFSGNYLLNFINEILEINRIDAEKVEIENIEFNIRELLNDINSSMSDLAHKNNNILSLEIDKNIPEILMGDPTKLSQIFINLINNALKFTKNGNVKVLANSIYTKDENIQIHFEVQDTGIGIPTEKQKTIFDIFSQGSVEINRKYGGTGLGLTIVKKTINLLGGDIELQSKVNTGSVFKFDLFFAIGQNSIQNQKPVEIQNEILADKKVLIVEDNKINQMITKKMLQKKGMVCEIIDNGEDAVTILKNKPDFDLVLMDVHLPGINGTIATEKIREFDTKTPIIALTAISLNENREMLLSFGMNEVITKPFDPEIFYSKISEILS